VLERKIELLLTHFGTQRSKGRADTTKPRPTRPNQWWGTDMTKVMIDSFGWVYLVVVLGWHSKKVVAHHAGPAGAGVALAGRAQIAP
jgi:hypothetical protein